MIIAGPNGSGKTTFVSEYLRDSEMSVYISAEHPQEIASGEGNEVRVINETFFEIFMQDIRNGGT